MKQTPADVYRKVEHLELRIEQMEQKVKRIQGEIKLARKRKKRLLNQVK